MNARPIVVPDDTKRRQRLASDPEASVWVGANAGSGKTWVLSRRVMRLLLAGTPPSRILCLTFTKAAAATMSNRVFQELAKWAVADDASLAAALADVTGGPVGAAEQARARRLFAAAIETPGGLKIQTIHGFCERILQQFPLEADLAGNFEILDEASERELVAAARSDVLIAAASETEDGRLARAFATVMSAGGEFGFLAALDELVRQRDAFRETYRTVEIGDFGRIETTLAAALDLPPGDTPAKAEAEILVSPAFPGSYLSTLVDALRATGKVSDLEIAERFETALSASDPAARTAAWTSAFFTRGGEPRSEAKFGTKAVRDGLPDLGDRFRHECERLAAIRDRLAAHRTLTASLALIVLGDAVVASYERAKRARGALDFDDLIGRTADLLSRSDAAQWVQYKLDQGIDHILVDEAQDTSPRQWHVVRQLAQEFFVGATARSGRTVFAVGDEKQSIYSFQGAAPREFAANREHFGAAAVAAGETFRAVPLDLSFRSTPDVLAAVDRVFADPMLRAGMTGDGGWQDHTAVRDRDPGLVEIWPPVLPVPVAEPEDWTAPVDSLTGEAPVLVLARRIADEIGRLTAPGYRLPGTGRRVRPKDVLILVRKRGPFVEAMNRILKERGIPVAGADRLVLTDHIAVMDLIALGRFVLLPQDDLSLAELLKSPLFGWTDDHLFEIAGRRESRRTTLWRALAERAPLDPVAGAAYERLRAWRARADLVPPYEFFAHILSAEGGRRAFAERLGPEAEDVLDEFLARALAYDDLEAPSLAGFLHALEAAPPEIKREMDEARDEVRVMTVHGAKGLEAAVVFLVDGGGKPAAAGHAPKLARVAAPGPDGAAPLLVWCPDKQARCGAVARALDRWKREAEEEYRRLLYVGMTRAADILYVVAHAGPSGLDDACWYRSIERALAGPEASPVHGPEGTVIATRWRASDHPPVPPADETGPGPASAGDDVLPDWVGRPAPPSEAAMALRPSKALAEAETRDGPPSFPARSAFEAALTPESSELRRGRIVHKLLEILPGLVAEERRPAAERFVGAVLSDDEAEIRRALVDEVFGVLDHPDFASAFAPGSRAEVAIAGELTGSEGRRYAVSGQIDRLAVGPDEVLVVDYKTNRDPPLAADAIPRDYVAQMAVYRQVLARLFPGRRIRAVILWTARPALAEVPAEAMDAVLATLSVS